jgi:diketogulonate reductase-like aldo/keto reductase
MYGQSEDLLGQILDDYPRRNELFLATKVWIKGKPEGAQQISESFKKMNTTKMELIQIHNLVDWKTQIKTLRQMKESGEISYIGITHYKSSAFKEMEDIIKKEPIDFAQFNYSIGERDAEERLLPICQEYGVATIINRPFMRGKLFRSFNNQTLPDWCKDYDINSWGQFFLKYIIANPAVTNIIPATSKSKNMLDNSIAGMGRVTDLKIQKRMLEML